MVKITFDGYTVEVAQDLEGAVFTYNHCIARRDPTMTLDEWLEAFNLNEHHTSTVGGYVSRKNRPGVAAKYIGRYGAGVIVDRPRWDTSRFVTRIYYLYGVDK